MSFGCDNSPNTAHTQTKTKSIIDGGIKNMGIRWQLGGWNYVLFKLTAVPNDANFLEYRGGQIGFLSGALISFRVDGHL